MREMTTTKRLPDYDYMPLDNGVADVFIYEFIKELEEGFLYNVNEFRTMLSEDEIRNNLEYYLHYEEVAEESSEEKIKRLEDEVKTLTFTIKKISDEFMEVIKKDSLEMPEGDYLNPIQFIEGMNCTKNLFYIFDDGNIWECIKSGNAQYTSEWFDIIV